MFTAVRNDAADLPILCRDTRDASASAERTAPLLPEQVDAKDRRRFPPRVKRVSLLKARVVTAI